MMLSTFQYTCSLCVCLLLRNAYSNILLIFWSDYKFFSYRVVWAPYIVWSLIPCQMGSLQIFLPFLWVVSSLWWLFPLLCRSFLTSCVWSHLSSFALGASASWVLLQKFLPRTVSWSVSPVFSCSSFIGWRLNPFWFDFYIRWEIMVKFHSSP